jgi:hypothetical protein
MKFNNIDEIQALIDRTTSTEDRLQSSLLLLNGKFAELNDAIAGLKRFSEKFQRNHAEDGDMK